METMEKETQRLLDYPNVCVAIRSLMDNYPRIKQIFVKVEDRIIKLSIYVPEQD